MAQLTQEEINENDADPDPCRSETSSDTERRFLQENDMMYAENPEEKQETTLDRVRRQQESQNKRHIDYMNFQKKVPVQEKNNSLKNTV